MHKLTVILVFSLLLTGISIGAAAQSISVKGKVTDTDGNPLAGVTIFESDRTSNGTASDRNGDFSITVPETASLVFSCLGYKEEIYKVPRRGILNVSLEDENLTLDAAEVVEIGYGSVTRRDLTGSVTKADVASIKKSAVTKFDQALQGRIAGVVVTTSDGALGSEANIIIRGNNSLTQSNEPLYVIDGMQMTSSMALYLNPSDIESIDVLKDASASAIYGARGANGVIVITTKQGVEGRPKVTFEASWTGSHIANKVDLMNAYQFVELQTDFYNATGATNTYLTHNNVTYSLDDYLDARSYDWQDSIYRTSLTQNYSVSVTGGSKNSGTRYTASFSALDQGGIIVKSNFQRYQGRLKLSQDIGKHVNIDLNVNYSRAVTNGITPTDAQQSSSASGWLIYSVWGYRPVKPIWDTTSDDEFLVQMRDSDIESSNDYRFNPALTVRNEYRKDIRDNLSAQLGVHYTIIPGLVLNISGNYNLRDRRREEFNGSQTYSGYEGSPSGKGVNGAIYWYNYVTWIEENTLTWTKDIRNQHHLSLVGGFTMEGQNENYQGVSATQMTTESLGINGLNTGNYQNVTPYERDWTLMSGLFRLQYNYKYKYYLTASFRADGSSRFAQKHRWGYFPSAALSWNFNREEWLKNSKWFKTGKIRASWGLTGNNRTSTPYDYYAIITTNPGGASSKDYVINGEIVSGYYPSNMENDDLKWETTEQWDVGLDLAFLEGNRIKFTADWYLKNTRDLLLQATMPASSGYTSAMMNIGSTRNMGVELSLETININKRNFQWTTSINIAFNRNTVTALTTNQYSLFSSISWDSDFNSQYPYITQVGKPTGMMYGYIYEGTYKTSDFDGNLLKDGIAYLDSVGKDNVKPGDPRYADINGDGIVDDNDRAIIGCGQPLHTGGFNNTFSFYGVDINVFFSWSYGNDILNANRLIFEAGTRGNLNQFTSYTRRYDSERNPDSDIPAVRANGMNVYSSRVVEDGSFLRLKNVSIGYTFPEKLLQRSKISNLRLHVSADNIWTWTKYSGPDPEVSTKSSILTPGFDWSAYPRAFGLTGGLSITF